MKLRPSLPVLTVLGTIAGSTAVSAGIYLRFGLWAALIAAGAALVALCLTVNV